MRECILLTGWLSLVAVGLFGQTERYKFRQLSINEGLSHNQVYDIYKDHKGFVWIGTAAGLNRFDGHDVKVFRRDPRDTTTLPSNNVTSILGAPDGALAVQTSEGLAIYNPATERFSRNVTPFFRKWGVPEGQLLDIKMDGDSIAWFVMPDGLVLVRQHQLSTEVFRHVAQDTTSIAPQSITSFDMAATGHYWLAHGNGIIEKLELSRSGLRVVYRNDWLARRNNHASYDYRLASDRDGDLWIWLNNDNQGVYIFNPRDEAFTRYSTSSEPIRLSANIVTGIVHDNSGMIWVGTDHGGINIIDKKNKTVRYVYHRDDDPAALAQNSVNKLYRDNSGIVWAGTYKSGVSYYHESIFRFTLFKHSSNDPDGLPYSDVNRFAEDQQGNLWIGTNGGGLIRFDRIKGEFVQYRHDPRNVNSLSSDVIVSLWVDHTNALWVGTYYGGLNRFDGRNFIRYAHDPYDSASIPGRSVWEIFEDSKKNLWIGTLEGGLAIYNRETNSFDRLRGTNGSITSSPYISAIMEDRRGNIWIGTNAGIGVYNPDAGTSMHYEYVAGNPSSLSSNLIYDLLEDVRGRIWVATQEGINVFDPETQTFRTLAEKGIPHNSPVLTLEEDLQGHIWMGSLQGLVSIGMIEDDSVMVNHYTQEDGLQSLQFNENASFRTRRGELIFGGPRGFNIFNPAEVKDVQGRNQLVFTDFQLFQKSIGIGETVKGRVILEKSITETKEIVLPAGQNFFSIEFSALNFLQPGKNEYWYKLEGLHSDWLPIDPETRKITFTNLSPKHYTLRVIADQGNAPTAEASLEIEVLPPFYKSNLAFVLYLILLLVILFFARKLIQQREKLKFAVEHERQEAMRMHELDMMKIRFFTNVSHEFRTPLTLILTPVERMLKQMSESEHFQTFQLIHRNAKRLLTLVNQLLDFRKMEVQEIRFSPSEGDIIAFIRETVLSFSDLSEKKAIQLTFSSDVQSLETIFDQDKLEKILFNLLSNAFKFTPDKGRVSVSVSMDKRPDSNWVTIRVSDTGIGIPQDKLERIFERFFQHELPRTMMNQGSGIGLSITHEFVRISKGEIKVESRVGEGSLFTVGLPVPEISGFSKTLADAPPPLYEVTTAAETRSEPGEISSLEHSLLLIEDNDDFRFYLKDNLKLTYKIYEAATGESGWDLCLQTQPDLVVSDVMMPGMNGVELCRKIKSDERVSHIPVILLTARTSDDQRIEGFETGADDYITKPFNFEILESRIRNLIALRKRSQKSFRKTLEVKASELNITPLDTRFIENAVKCVEKNVSSPEFTVEDLGRELGFSRAYLYKKIVALTGKSPLEFIRHIRLQHAAQLLEKSQMTVAEIAYQVGFNNPKYFARYFKEEFKELPSGYAAARRNAKPK